jgi:hypothetical protein
VPLYTAQGFEANVSCDNYVLKPGTKYLLYLRPLPSIKGITWPAMFNLGGCLLRLLSDEQTIAEDRKYLGIGFRPASSTADR